MKTKLFERLVTKFSIKVNDLAKYLEISKATIYNYRNLDNFSDIPSDKQLKIFYLFGKENSDELELVLDESDTDVLNQYLDRISSILKGSIQTNKDSLQSIESLLEKTKQLENENQELKNKLDVLNDFENLDALTRNLVLRNVGNIVKNASGAQIRSFLEYLEIFESYINK